MRYEYRVVCVPLDSGGSPDVMVVARSLGEGERIVSVYPSDEGRAYLRSHGMSSLEALVEKATRPDVAFGLSMPVSGNLGGVSGGGPYR